MISRTAEYALRAVLFLARQPEGAIVRAADIADALRIPANYLSKILHILGRTDLLVSERGRRGGFQLARPAAEISLAEVIGPFDELEERGDCLLGRARCSEKDPCAAHTRWRAVHETVTSFFAETTVADLLEQPAASFEPALSEGGADAGST
jgi:Rrf2 family protein